MARWAEDPTLPVKIDERPHEYAYTRYSDTFPRSRTSALTERLSLKGSHNPFQSPEYGCVSEHSVCSSPQGWLETQGPV
jgi:hypothetical protein